EQGTQQAGRQEELERRRQAAAQERDALAAQHGEIQRRIIATQHSLDAASARRHELTGRLHQLRDELAGQRAQARLREELWRHYEGFPETVKLLMERSVEGLIGPLVDLIQAAPGYEGVVETALGPLAEALVVRDRASLSRCRQALSAQQAESCRFLVLSDCPSAASLEPAAAEEVVSGAVKQYVKTAPQYQPLVDWLLNDSWVVEDIDRLLSRPTAPRSRVVSLRGDRWDRRSWRFGAPRASSHGRLGRKQRWEDAQRKLEVFEQDFTRLEGEAKEAERQWQAVLGEQESAKAQLAHVAPQLQKLDHQLAQLAHEASRMSDERSARELETRELAAAREELRTA
ncbi:MAG TPA: hypothetical protein VJB16_06345, partial [archaeon]|nr:hypothetical protein [archaeon]